MHAFLLTGHPEDSFTKDVEALSKKINAKILEFPLLKIEDVRNLNDLIRLSFNEPTLIVSKNIHQASLEALNAFLKNLEEPKENIYFALTAPSSKKVLATIVSRCQIVRLKPEAYKKAGDANVEDFPNMNVGQKLLLFDKMKDRAAAINFINELLFFLHSRHDLKNMEILIKTLTGLNGNGNVNLQLTNLVMNFK